MTAPVDYDPSTGREGDTKRNRWGAAKAMRYVAMQVLTWGTIAGAIGSALLLAALESPAPRYRVENSMAPPLPIEPTQAGRGRPATPPTAASEAASSPRLAER
jgi:hypothetical protein